MRSRRMVSNRSSRVLTCSWLVFVAVFATVDGGSTNSTIGRLVENLMKNYVIVRPVEKWGDPVMVNMSFSLSQIKDLDGKYQMLGTSGFLVMVWKDPSLSWDPSDYEGVNFVETHAANVWTPRIGLRNSATHVVNKDWVDAFGVYVYADGTVVWVIADYFESTCHLNMLMFPFDTQTCSLNFGNVFHDSTLVDLTGQPEYVNTDFFFPSKEFDLRHTYVEKEVSPLNLHTVQEIPEIHFTLVMARRPDYYVLNVIVPVVVLAFLSACKFCVPEESGEKLSMGITLLLSFTVFLLLLSGNTPQTSGPLPLVCVYLSLVICISGMSLFIQMLVMIIYHIDPVPAIPRCLRRVMDCAGCLITKPKEVNPSWTSQYLTLDEMRTESVANNQTSTPIVKVDYSAVIEELKKISAYYNKREKDAALRAEWHLAANIVDRICFIVFLSIHIILIVLALTILPLTERHGRSTS